MMRIVVMYPTWGEARPFMLGSAGGTAEVWRCGIGAVECAARTAGVLAARRPDFILLAGIAGAHPSVGLAKGDTVMVSREYAADVGTLREGRFIPLPVDGNDVKNNFYDNPTSVPPLFRSVASDTVAVAGTPVRAESAAGIENMEGAGFFAVCGALGVPFAELRCISNYIGEERGRWRIAEAVGRLAEDVGRFIDAVREWS
ncbi:MULTISPECIES: phosphorylase family protein [Rikenellaceae]|uniref:Nucleoside phosphorylase domain-containing protein n=1 Tax=Alistipes inops TaxID=1501391 RepID=A0ABR4YIY1_9BACT|nr:MULTISPECIES: hypothetical protein [Rikenellaceae]KHE42225.1 hypothetical protein LG35_04805 [Alistipes inops]